MSFAVFFRRAAPALILSIAVVVAPALAADTDADADPGACRVLRHGDEALAGRIDDIPAGAALALTGAERIGDVVLLRRQIFDAEDPAENNAVFMLANRLHVLTREHPILEQMPFASGDAYEPLELVEAERILRNQEWLFDARVVPVRQCGEVVDIAVVTRDVWSILPTGDVNRSGGESSFAIGVKDENLLGRGETLGVYYEDGVDREGVAGFYRDPSVAGTPWRLDLFASDNSDGGRFAINLRHPFRSLDERVSRGGSLTLDKRVQPLFDTGFRSAEFVQRSRTGQVFIAGSSGRVAGRIQRWSTGLAFFDHEFSREPGALQPLALPTDRRAVYPFVGIDLIEDDYAAEMNLSVLGRAEDIYLGQRLTASLGYAPDAFGADEARLVFNASWRDAVRPVQSVIITGYTRLNGVVRTEDGEGENVYATVGGELHHLQTDAFRFYASVDATWTDGLTVDNQLQLGGENGLRGFPQRFQQGDRRVRLRLEERWFSSAHPLRLFRFGAAAFVDAGRAWFPGDPDDDDEEGWLANVGVGLRLASSRASASSMMHLDLAVPLQRDGREVEGVQISLTLKETF